jgi:hypothetical protein
MIRMIWKKRKNNVKKSGSLKRMAEGELTAIKRLKACMKLTINCTASFYLNKV